MMNEDYVAGYDRFDPISIEKYSQKMIGKTFRQIWEEDEAEKAKRKRGTYEERVSYGSAKVSETKRNKGNLGQIVEERFFHYACNSNPDADFHEAGVELKVTPYRIKKDGSLSAKERLILSMIDYYQVANETFEKSHLWSKSKLMLLVYYLYSKETEYNLDYRIGYCRLFTPPEKDMQTIKRDFEKIVAKIKEGKAHELSESDTTYLGAAPKAATSKDRREQPFSSIPAKPRAFAFKSSYMTYVLNTYIAPGKVTYEPIMRDGLMGSLEDYVVERINRYRGHSVDELCKEFNVSAKCKPKNLGAMLAYRILGVKGGHAEEFVKANIVVRTIRIGTKNRIKECMPFPAFRFKELIREDWKNSTFGNYLRETRFLFVIYKFDEGNELRLCGCQFWNVPYEDLETEVKAVWKKTKRVIQDGLQIEKINGKWRSNLPGISENPVCHVRPHGRNAQDTDELPDGRYYPKQCFWFNNTYIYKQIKSEIKVDQINES